MGLLDLVRRAVFTDAPAGIEQRALPPGATLLSVGGTGERTWAARSDSPSVGVDVALSHSAVWAAVRLLADSVASLPVDVYGPDGRQVPTPPVLVEPAAGSALSEWIEAAMRSLLLRGNAFGLVTARSGPSLLPSQVELVHPDLVSVSQDPNTGALTYRVGGQAFDRHQMWHSRAFVMPGVALGLSPISAARQSIGLGLAAERFGGEYMASGGAPTVLIENLDPDQTQADADKLKAKYMESQRVRQPLVTNPFIKVTPITIRADESQFIETVRASVQDIARFFGVPAEMIGSDSGSSLTYTTTEGRARDFLRYALAPWLVRLEHALARLLPAGHSVKFNADALLRGTTTERYEAYREALAGGWLTVDEVRELEDLPPLPAGQTPTQDDRTSVPSERTAADGLHVRDESDLFIYWTVGPGRAKWATGPQPLAALYAQLGKHMTDQKAAATALAWFEVGMGRKPTKDDGEVPDRPTKGDKAPTKGSAA